MRSILSLALAALLLTGCFDGDDVERTCTWNGMRHQVGDIFPAGDGCNECQCQPEGVACTLVACEDLVDAAPSCAPLPGVCAVGPQCGAVCCDTGEQCVDGACQCGDRAACPSGDTCTTAGPVGQDGCGSICCGASGPCPL